MLTWLLLSMGNSVWIDRTDRFLVEPLVKSLQNGDQGENVFKKQVWKLWLQSGILSMQQFCPSQSCTSSQKLKSVL